MLNFTRNFKRRWIATKYFLFGKELEMLQENIFLPPRFTSWGVIGGVSRNAETWTYSSHIKIILKLCLGERLLYFVVIPFGIFLYANLVSLHQGGTG